MGENEKTPFESSFRQEFRPIIQEFAKQVALCTDLSDIVVLVARKAVALYRALIDGGLLAPLTASQVVSSYAISLHPEMFKGARVAVIDDVMLTGRSSASVASYVRSLGGTPFILVPAYCEELCQIQSERLYDGIPLLSSCKLDVSALYALARETINFILSSGGSLSADLPFYRLSTDEACSLRATGGWWDCSSTVQSLQNISSEVLLYSDEFVFTPKEGGGSKNVLRLKDASFRLHLLIDHDKASAVLLPEVDFSALSESDLLELIGLFGESASSKLKELCFNNIPAIESVFRKIRFYISAYFGRKALISVGLIPRDSIIQELAHLLFGDSNALNAEAGIRGFVDNLEPFYPTPDLEELVGSFTGVALSALAEFSGNRYEPGPLISRKGIRARFSLRSMGSLGHRQIDFAESAATAILGQRGYLAPYVKLRFARDTYAIFQGMRPGESFEPTLRNLYLAKCAIRSYCLSVHNAGLDASYLSRECLDRLVLLFLRSIVPNSKPEMGDVEKALMERPFGEVIFCPNCKSVHFDGVTGLELLGLKGTAGDILSFKPDSLDQFENRAVISFSQLFSRLASKLSGWEEFKQFLDILIASFQLNYKISCLQPFINDISDYLSCRMVDAQQLKDVATSAIDFIKQVESSNSINDEIEKIASLLSEDNCSLYSDVLARIALSDRDDGMDKRVGEYLIKSVKEICEKVKDLGHESYSASMGENSIWLVPDFAFALKRRFYSIRMNDFKLIGGEITSAQLVNDQVRVSSLSYESEKSLIDSALFENDHQAKCTVLYVDPGLRPSWIPINKSSSDENAVRYCDIYPEKQALLLSYLFSLCPDDSNIKRIYFIHSKSNECITSQIQKTFLGQNINQASDVHRLESNQCDMTCGEIAYIDYIRVHGGVGGIMIYGNGNTVALERSAIAAGNNSTASSGDSSQSFSFGGGSALDSGQTEQLERICKVLEALEEKIDDEGKGKLKGLLNKLKESIKTARLMIDVKEIIETLGSFVVSDPLIQASIEGLISQIKGLFD